MKNNLLLFLIFLSLSINVPVNADSERPGLYGFSPAYPVEIPEIFSSDVNPPYLTDEAQFILLLDIDKKGDITKTTQINENESRVGEYVKFYLNECIFKPAQFNNNPVSSLLPIKILINPRIESPDIEFPVDTKLKIKDPEFYSLTLQYNDIRLPSVKYFPKYFCNIDWDDSLDIYPFILLQLDLDDQGEVENVNEILSTYSNYTMTLMSASLWSEFIPAKVRDSNISCSSYLLISLFPQLYYPTRKYYEDRSDTLSIHEKNRIRFIPDSISIMQKPMPRIVNGENILVPGIPGWISDTLSLFVTVDTSGKAQINRSGKTNAETYRIMREVFSQLKFYPAIGFEGNPVEYSGLIQLIIKGSEKVRISYLW